MRIRAAVTLLALLAPAAATLAADVIVNGVRLEDSTRQAFERSYGGAARYSWTAK